MPFKDKEEERTYKREWARRNGKTLKRNQVSAKRKKQMVIDAKSHACVICNKTYPHQCMDLHHIDPDTKISGIAELMRIASYKTLKEEIDKCAPLCANCHRLLHAGLAELPEDLVVIG
tara:strand:+ start:90 stop:443 length:354 start_codon:yes stop_codon:yes gene_type:complete